MKALAVTQSIDPVKGEGLGMAVLDLEDGYLDVRDPGKTGARRQLIL